MSSVRMCDKCHTVFSELMDGWQSYSATTTKRDANGEAKSVVVHMDACPSCALIPSYDSKENADLKEKLAASEPKARVPVSEE